MLFTLGGALMGLGYYALVGCSTGSCAITASPVNTILYMGLMGWLLSGIFGLVKVRDEAWMDRQGILP